MEQDRRTVKSALAVPRKGKRNMSRNLRRVLVAVAVAAVICASGALFVRLVRACVNGWPPECYPYCESYCECIGTGGCTSGSGGGSCGGTGGTGCVKQAPGDGCSCKVSQCGGAKNCPGDCCGASQAGNCKWCPKGGSATCGGTNPCKCRSDSSACTKCGTLCKTLSNPGGCTQCACTCGQTACRATKTPPQQILPGEGDWAGQPGGPCSCARYNSYTCDGTANSAAHNCCQGCGDPGSGKLGVGCGASVGGGPAWCIVHCGSSTCPCTTPTLLACACTNSNGYCWGKKKQGTCKACPKPGNTWMCKDGGGGAFVACTSLTYP